MRKEPVCHDGVLLRDETPARWCTSLFLKASRRSSSVVHALLSSFSSLLLILHVSFPQFLGSSSSVPRFRLCFHSSPQLRPREGWTRVADRPVEGLLLETWACQGGKRPPGSEGALRPMKPFLRTLLVWRRRKEQRKGQGAGVGRLGSGWSKAVSQADGQCWAREETLDVWWFDSHIFFWLSSRGILILIRTMDSVRISRCWSLWLFSDLV